MGSIDYTADSEGYDGYWECKNDPTHDTRTYTVCDDCAELAARRQRLELLEGARSFMFDTLPGD